MAQPRARLAGTMPAAEFDPANLGRIQPEVAA
jgi:hypothetical protein